jgi:transcriptional regulator with XRE-family HTH domain
MNIDQYLSDEQVLSELGTRLERARLERNLTQRELAVEAGVARKAIQRIEAGGSVTLTSFIRVLRALGLIETLDRLIEEPAPSPIELLKLRGKRRRRASGEHRRKSPEEHADEPWRWGDERSGRPA